MTCDFRWIVSSVAHLPAAACTTWAPGSKPPLGRGGEVGQRALRVLMVFPVVSVRLCEEPLPARDGDARLAAQMHWEHISLIYLKYMSKSLIWPYQALIRLIF